MKKLFWYLNPIAHLGEQKYNWIVPSFVIIFISFLSEFYAFQIANDPQAVGAYIIFVHAVLIIYFAFRWGAIAGILSSLLAIAYYFYIIYSRHYTELQFAAAIQTSIVLGFVYLLVGGIIGWLKQAIDSLIEREANEKQRLLTIVEQLPVGVLITDKNGSIVQANKRLEEIMGMRFPKGTTAGKDMVVYSEYKGNPAKPSDSATALALSTGKPVLGREYVVTRKDGQKRHVLVNATPIIGKSGRIFAAASIISDITTQKELEQRKDDFLNMASHELKTPITSLKVYLHTLQTSVKKFRDEKTNKMLAGTIYQMDKLQKLVVDLLDVSRLQTGKLSFTMEEFRLDELVGEAIEELQATTTDHTITYIGRKAMFAHGDKFRIYQVLTNLINNAVKYSPDKAKVVVRIRKEGRKNIVSVQDFGIGIDEGEKEKIFERLYQVNDVVGQSFPGFGMGLYIAREIVKRHKGNIWVNSTKGKGSIFYFSLPVPKSKKLKQEK